MLVDETASLWSFESEFESGFEVFSSLKKG